MNDETNMRFHDAKREQKKRVAWHHPGRQAVRSLWNQLASSMASLDLTTGDRLLDFGCANKPYRDLLPEGVEHIGADLPGNPDADVLIKPSGELAVADASCDAVLSTQVLEHVHSPSAYLDEAFRVLKPGGKLLLSTHGLWIYHEDPVDYWRWTGAGLQEQLRRSGFVIEELEGVLGLAAAAVQLFQDATYYKLPRWLGRPYAVITQTMVGFFDHLHQPQSRRQNAFCYVVVAHKPQ